MKRTFWIATLAAVVAATAAVTAGQVGADRLTASVLKGIELRGIGPSLATGRSPTSPSTRRTQTSGTSPRPLAACGRP